MLGRGRHRHRDSKHRRQEDRQRRTVDIVDLRTGLTHLLTPDAADAGLVAICGITVLPAGQSRKRRPSWTTFWRKPPPTWRRFPYRVADLDEFDRCASPRVAVRAVFDLLARAGRRLGETDDEYLTYLATCRHRLGGYRGGSSGLDEESRAFAVAHFQALGLAVGPGEVLVFCGGFKGALICVCAALMAVRRHDELRHTGGWLLAPVGYYQSLRLIPTVSVMGLTSSRIWTVDTVGGWLAGTRGASGGRIVYVPLVNNVDGRVLSKARACSIAAVVLEHNQRYRDNPVWVLADDVYAGSYLSAGLTPQPSGALRGMGPPACLAHRRPGRHQRRTRRAGVPAPAPGRRLVFRVAGGPGPGPG